MLFVMPRYTVFFNSCFVNKTALLVVIKIYLLFSIIFLDIIWTCHRISVLFYPQIPMTKWFSESLKYWKKNNEQRCSTYLAGRIIITSMSNGVLSVSKHFSSNFIGSITSIDQSFFFINRWMSSLLWQFLNMHVVIGNRNIGRHCCLLYLYF